MFLFHFIQSEVRYLKDRWLSLQYSQESRLVVINILLECVTDDHDYTDIAWSLLVFIVYILNTTVKHKASLSLAPGKENKTFQSQCLVLESNASQSPMAVSFSKVHSLHTSCNKVYRDDIYQWYNEDMLSSEACSYRLSEKEIKDCWSPFYLAKWSRKDFIHSISGNMNEMIFWAYKKEQQLHKLHIKKRAGVKILQVMLKTRWGHCISTHTYILFLCEHGPVCVCGHVYIWEYLSVHTYSYFWKLEVIIPESFIFMLTHHVPYRWTHPQSYF